MFLDIHSTRLFPKNRGANAYQLAGIASRCDWVVMTDTKPPTHYIRQNRKTTTPRHIFLSLRSPFEAIAVFTNFVLPKLHQSFVLVSGSEDVTIPNQYDHRWRRFNAEERTKLQEILSHPLLLHWFAENLDDASHPKFSALPTGMVFPNSRPHDGVAIPTVTPISQRPLRVLCAHRTRSGPQWSTRKHVSALARSAWQRCCTVLDEEVSEADFLQLVEDHSFVLCVEGGGLDPSPKAWQTILHGAIPIVRRTGTQQAYAKLPVAFVHDWLPDTIDPTRLLEWRDILLPDFDQPSQRRLTLRRLSADYWWAPIEKCARPRNSGG